MIASSAPFVRTSCFGCFKDVTHPIHPGYYASSLHEQVNSTSSFKCCVQQQPSSDVNGCLRNHAHRKSRGEEKMAACLLTSLQTSSKGDRPLPTTLPREWLPSLPAHRSLPSPSFRSSHGGPGGGWPGSVQSSRVPLLASSAGTFCYCLTWNTLLEFFLVSLLFLSRIFYLLSQIWTTHLF